MCYFLNILYLCIETGNWIW